LRAGCPRYSKENLPKADFERHLQDHPEILLFDTTSIHAVTAEEAALYG
jgi:hypothetical protein